MFFITHQGSHTCSDAITSLAICSKYAKTKHTEFNYLELNQQENNLFFENNKNRLSNQDIYFVDVSPTIDMLLKLKKIAKNIYILDHHNTGFIQYKKYYKLDPNAKHIKHKFENVYIEIDLDRSGALITWDYLFKTKAPQMVKHVSDGDLYRFKMPLTRGFIHELNKTKMTIDNWEQHLTLTNTEIKKIAEQGNTDLKPIDNIIDSILTQVRWVKVYQPKNKETITGGFAVCPHTLRNRLGERMVNELKCGFALILTTMETNHIRLSLRSCEDGVNVRKIAEELDGGGHDQAAATRLTYQQFSEFVQIEENIIKK